MVIYKYVLKDRGDNKITLPNTAKVLSVQQQGPDIVIWVMFDDESPYQSVGRIFFVCYTGEPFKVGEHCTLLYIGTVQSGPIVYHIFEKDYPF